MPTIDDLFHSTLSTLGYDGAVPDQILEYLGSLGYTGTIDDRWNSFCSDRSYANLHEYLGAKGYTGSIQDRIHTALSDGAFFGPVGDGILLEDGFYLLAENTDYLIQE